ncbi:sugar phosphate isomerase/epimerase family protein [Thermofilum pendens]|uniref:sugar phosphate isomerase/epimerase family protein n=1 Tax=Thermofilum pendens TaxID=2269 RepID=UPI00069C6880|nr:sugar phosphate isomerase/epimerase family protein [Thermofilum pendens]
MRLGVSTYSYWHFEGPRLPLREYLRRAYEDGFAGVEVLVDHVESRARSYLKEVRRFAFEHGLEIYAVALHNNFVRPDPAEREAEVKRVVEWLNVAYELGADVVRVDSGRWGTVKSFDELMARRGVEPPLEGYSEDDAVEWVVDCLYRCLDAAEELGVIVGLENHWGLTTRAETMLKIVRRVSSRWFGVVMDTGNFVHDTYSELEAIAPYAVMVHAKTYFGGGVWYTLDLDYGRIFGMLRRHGFKGWVSLEYEGREDYSSGVRKSRELLMRYVGGGTCG